MIFTYDHKMSDNQRKLVNRVFSEYAAKYPPEVISMGVKAFNKNESTELQLFGSIINIPDGYDTTFAHLRVPYMKQKEEYSLSEENVQPFVLAGRYIAMHNGYIKGLARGDKSDSRVLFENWLAIHRGAVRIKDTFLPYIQKFVSANAILYDTETDEIVAYHGRGKIPPLYIHGPTHTISNFKIYEKSIELAPGQFFTNY